MHRREGHPWCMGWFVDFSVGIREFAGDMKFILICFALLTHVVLLLCFCYSLVPFYLLGGCQTQWGPPGVLNPPQVPFLFLEHHVPLLEHLFYF